MIAWSPALGSSDWTIRLGRLVLCDENPLWPSSLAISLPKASSPSSSRSLATPCCETHGHLVLARDRRAPSSGLRMSGTTRCSMPISSIGDAAKKLRAIQRNWALYSFAHHRRAALIADKLPKVSAKPLVFGAPAPAAPLGSWTLIAPDQMLASAVLLEPVPQRRGALRRGPHRAQPRLSQALGAVHAARRAAEAGRALPRSRRQSRRLELGAARAGRARHQRRQGAARSARRRPCPVSSIGGKAPSRSIRAAVGPVDWLFSDVVCYPKRLLALVQRWLAAGTVRCFVCTIKFQGATDFEAMRRSLPSRDRGFCTFTTTSMS